MRKYLVALAVVAALGLAAQVNSAKAFILNDRSPSVTAAQIVVGGGMTAAYFALNCNQNFSRCHKFGSATSAKWFTLTTIGCMAIAPMFAAALVGHYEHRELKSSEVFMITGDCVVPILGGLFWRAMFAAHPEWDNGTGGPTKR